jgi:hypothetical protein
LIVACGVSATGRLFADADMWQWQVPGVQQSAGFSRQQTSNGAGTVAANRTVTHTVKIAATIFMRRPR